LRAKKNQRRRTGKEKPFQDPPIRQKTRGLKNNSQRGPWKWEKNPKGEIKEEPPVRMGKLRLQES